MNAQIEKLRTELINELGAIHSIENPLEMLTKASRTLDNAINDLNNFVENHKFSNEQDEIIFFKIVKPEFISLRIEEVMRYNLAINKPIGTAESQLKYYEEELKALQSFFRMNSFHYQYYRNGLSELDSQYFLRSALPLSVPLADITETDPLFSTPVSFLFAKFIAFEHLQYHILEQIAHLKYPELSQPLKTGGAAAEMKWTGDVINIIELAYGIWLTGQLNNGNASLNQIVRWLEGNLQVNIGNVQRRFIEIERRKRLSPTKYLDQMRSAVIQKIESGNA